MRDIGACVINRIFLVFMFLALLSGAFAAAMLGPGAVLISIAALFLFFLLSRASISRPRIWLLGAAAAAVGLRLFWVLTAKIEPFSDFDTYHNLAKSIAAGEGGAHGSVYISLFPHVLGTGVFFSIFYRLFGAAPLCAQLVNAASAGAATYLIYLIGSASGGKKGGVIAAYIWAIAPGAILHSEMVAGEMPFTLFMLLFVFLVLKINKKPTGLLFAALSGAVAALANAVRPLGAVLIIAGLIFIALSGKLRKKYFATAAFLLAGAYFLSSAAITAAIARQTGLPPGGAGAGYSLYVGANKEAVGMWNEEDARLLSRLAVDEGLCAGEVSKILAAKAITRYKEMGAAFFAHLGGKFVRLWSNDYIYASYVDPAGEKPWLKWLCNGWYVPVLVLAFLGALKKGGGESLLLKLIILGGAAVHLAAEVMGRYNYPFVVLFTILAGAALAGRGEGFLPGLRCGIMSRCQSYRKFLKGRLRSRQLRQSARH